MAPSEWRVIGESVQGSTHLKVQKPNQDAIAWYPDEGHGFMRPANNLSFMAMAEQFLAKCLGGRAAPLGNSLAGSSLIVEAGADYIPGLTEALAARK